MSAASSISADSLIDGTMPELRGADNGELPIRTDLDGLMARAKC
jgi:hypothetical protein